MISRRRFLGHAGVGLIAVPTGCQLPTMVRRADDDRMPNVRLSNPDSPAAKNRMLGYPVNMNDPPAGFIAWRQRLQTRGIDNFAHNNVGNPFRESPFPFNTHDYERATINSFGELLRFPRNDIWGFLSHSGTDSNMHGMYMGRTLLKGRTGRTPRVYFTREAHYSVQILADLLGLERVFVGTLPDGGLDADDLAVKLQQNNDAPALVVATIGTTFKGAIDDLDAIRSRLEGYSGYVHLDAALFGGYLPFTSGADQVACVRASDGLLRYDSIAISCHKFFGFASPAGLFITTGQIYDEFNSLFSRIHNPEYIHQVPGTITCSRDAVKPAEFFYYTTASARSRQTADARGMLCHTRYLLGQLNVRFPQLRAVRSNPLSNTVYFHHPGDAIVEKYSLATMNLPRSDGPQKYAHVVVMPHVNREIIDGFVDDLSEAGL